MSSSGASGAPPHVLEWTIKDKKLHFFRMSSIKATKSAFN
jgi:hypothetical protein